jgi:deoxycytidylate deaminase
MADQDVQEPDSHIVAKAVAEAMLSPCLSKRGAVVFDGAQVWARGHNRQVQPFTCTSDAACKASCRHSAIHAEQAALLRAGLGAKGREMLHVKAGDGRLVPSGPPSCAACSRLIVAAGITRMWLYHEQGWTPYDAWTFHHLSVKTQAGERDQLAQEITRLKTVIASLGKGEE